MRANKTFLNFDFAPSKNQDILTKQCPLNKEFTLNDNIPKEFLISAVIRF